MEMHLARVSFKGFGAPPFESGRCALRLEAAVFKLKRWKIALIHLELISFLFQLILGQLDLPHDSIAFYSC